MRELYLRLKKDGVDAWLDKEKLLPGQDWELEIRKAVREADVVVVCLSKQFNQAGFRQKEVRLALDTAMEKPEGEIFIIPARLEECDTLESLRKWHWVDLFEEDGYERLVRAMRARADKIGVTLQIRKSRTPRTKKPNEIIALENDIKRSQEKRIFYDLTAHYECDFENTTVVTSVNFLFETLTRIMRTVAGVDKNDNNRRVDYQTGQVKHLDPKDGKTTQHALIVQGRKIQSVSKGDDQVIEPLKLISDMLVITITQDANGSLVRFDSNELPNEAFKDLVEWILADLGKTESVQVKDDIPLKAPMPKQDQPAVKLPEQQNESASGALNAGRDISSGVIITGSNNVINVGSQETPALEKPKIDRSQPKKTKSPRKPNTTIVVALIGFVGTIIAALIGSPAIEKWFSPAPVVTQLMTSTITVTPKLITPSHTFEPSLTSTTTVTLTTLPLLTESPANISTPIVKLTATKYTGSLPIEITDAKRVTMRLVSGGEFTMGSEVQDDEKPIHQVYLDAFYMDKYEVTNALYQVCVEAGGCSLPRNTGFSVRSGSYYSNPEYKNYPVIFVDWIQAVQYCGWRGGSLPTEAQWEKAARGTDGRIYPWGDTFDSSRGNFCDKNCAFDWADKNSDDDGYAETAPVGNYESGKSPYGIYDLAGNVTEWVKDLYDAYPENTISNSDYGTKYRVLRGGAWDVASDLRVSRRYRNQVGNLHTAGTVGFRCVLSLP